MFRSARYGGVCVLPVTSGTEETHILSFLWNIKQSGRLRLGILAGPTRRYRRGGESALAGSRRSTTRCERAWRRPGPVRPIRPEARRGGPTLATPAGRTGSPAPAWTPVDSTRFSRGGETALVAKRCPPASCGPGWPGACRARYAAQAPPWHPRACDPGRSGSRAPASIND